MKMYKIIILGPQGSGKGTQAKLIAEHYGIEHISTGDISRAKKREDSELGRKVKELIDKGNLVPDEIMIPIVKEKIESLKGQGYILDGFPRNLDQAKALGEFSDITHVIYLDIPEETSIKRLSSRLMCKCGESYNKVTKPPKEENLCDKCGKELFQREDETPEGVSRRLEIYNKETKPLLDFYKDKLIKIDGEPAISEIFDEIKKVLD